MTITFEVVRDDLLAFMRENNARLRVLRRAYFQGFVWGPLLGIVLVAVTRLKDVGTAVMLVAICAGLGAAAWHLHWPSHLARVNNALLDEGLMKHEIGLHTVSLEAAGIREVADWGEVFRKWGTVEGVTVTRSHVLVSIAGQGPIVVVPRRAFVGLSDEDEFLRLIRERPNNEMQLTRSAHGQAERGPRS
jgi:hypothetical protein